MHVFSAYGLVIHCEWPLLEEDTSARQTSCDVVIKSGDLTGLNSAPHSDRIFGRLPGIGSFLFRAGREIVVDPQHDIDELTLRHCILGSAMAVLLQQRGLLVLHASCVAGPAGVFAFLGHSGSGKSTMASVFYRHGYQMLTDDVLAVALQRDQCLVYPGYPMFKLLPDAAAALGHSASNLPAINAVSSKVGHWLEQGFSAEPRPLRRIYSLHFGEQAAIDILPEHATFLELLKHSRASKLTQSIAHIREANFSKSIALLRSVPLRRLTRPRSLAQLDELIAKVENDAD